MTTSPPPETPKELTINQFWDYVVTYIESQYNIKPMGRAVYGLPLYAEDDHSVAGFLEGASFAMQLIRQNNVKVITGFDFGDEA